MLVVISIMEMSLKNQRQTNLTFQASTLRQSILRAVNNLNGWNNTIHAASNNQASGALLDCLYNGNPCTTNESSDLPAGGTAISGLLMNKIYDASNSVVYDSSTPDSGLSLQGTQCTGFSAVPGSGNDNCPLRYEVHWTAACKCTNPGCLPVVASDTCVNPQVKLQIVSIYNPGKASSSLAFNPANYGTPMFFQGSDPNDCWTFAGGNLYETCGNVGIGTKTPTAELHLNGPNGNGSTGIPLFRVSDTNIGNGTYFAVDNGAWQNAYRLVSANTNMAGPMQNLELQSGANSAQLVLNPNGNVGIGSANPAAKLDINGTLRLANQPIGTGCSTEGLLGYDYGAHTQVICDPSLFWSSMGANLIATTVDILNNAGGSPCHDACSVVAQEVVQWSVACAKRYCLSLGKGFNAGVAQEFDCISRAASVACFH